MLIFTGRRGSWLWRYDKITKVQFRGNEFTFHGIDNDAIINMVYQIFDTGVTVNFI